MGQCSFEHDNNLNHGENNSKSVICISAHLLKIICYAVVVNLSKNNFEFKYVIGRGGFGKV